MGFCVFGIFFKIFIFIIQHINFVLVLFKLFGNPYNMKYVYLEFLQCLSYGLNIFTVILLSKTAGKYLKRFIYVHINFRRYIVTIRNLQSNKTNILKSKYYRRILILKF